VRVKSYVSAIDSLYLGLIGSWVNLPTPDQIEYQWFTNGEKVPVFSVVTSDLGGNETVTSVEFKDKLRYFASVDEWSFHGDIFPNPATDRVDVLLQSTASLIEIVDLSGKVMFTTVPVSNSFSFEVDHWDAGLYILKSTTPQGIATTKFIVE
jgi:hypothetical protein